MTPTLRAPVLVPGVATGIGSLPHDDPAAAAELVLRCLPELPAVPQLPGRDPARGHAGAVAGGAARRWRSGPTDRSPCSASPTPHRSASSTTVRTRACSRSSTSPRRAERAPPRIKAQVTGPLTLGTALHAAGMPAPRAFDARRGRHACVVGRARRSWSTRACPTPDSCSSSTSPRWCRGDATTRRSIAKPAIDVLSGALAAVDSVTGVHVCSDGDLALALEAGPEVLGVEVDDDLVQHTVGLARFLDGDGWIAWGAVPDRSSRRRVGRSALARARRACGASSRAAGAIRCRSAPRGMITPACGLAGYGASQAERVLGIARELAARVHDQAVAARLTLGA